MTHCKPVAIAILMIALFACAASEVQADGLVLNEMMAINNATIADEFGEYDDWIEITNTGTDPIGLMGLNLTDDLSNPTAYAFPDITIGPGEYIIVWTDDDPEQGDLHAAFKLSSSGESVYLLDGGVILDDTIFGTMGADLSWGRWPDGTGEWKILGTATPGTENDDTEPETYALTLNEIMSDNLSTIEDPDEPGEYPDWIEIYNGESFPVDLGGMYLSDDSGNPAKFPIPAGVIVPAGGYLLFWADNETEQGDLHTNFKLSSAGESVSLYQGSVPLDSIEFDVIGTDLSLGRWPDGTGDWKVLGEASPGETNRDPDLPEYALYINEFMADNATTIQDPDEAGEYPDWIEIYNGDSSEIDLSGMYLTDEPGDLTKYPIPNGITIPAGGYIVFWADDENEQGPYHTNFKLSKSDEVVYLVGSDGATIIDGLGYGEQQTDVSYGRYPDGTDNWSLLTPSPGSTNTPASGTGMVLMLDDANLTAGDRFYLHFTLWPDSETYVTDTYILLSFAGQYWSWPNWTSLDQGVGFETYTVLPDTQIDVDVLDFTWPDLQGSVSGFSFYGAAFHSGSFTLIGELQIREFSYN